eukprot:366242-Chlamydomonas_euryale.AAC.13
MVLSAMTENGFSAVSHHCLLVASSVQAVAGLRHPFGRLAHTAHVHRAPVWTSGHRQICLAELHTGTPFAGPLAASRLEAAAACYNGGPLLGRGFREARAWEPMPSFGCATYACAGNERELQCQQQTQQGWRA